MKLFYSILIAFLLTVSAKAEIYTTPEGYQFEVNLVPEKTEIMLGEPIYLNFEVKNLSEVSLGMVEGGDYRNKLGRPESFSIAVHDERGNVVEKLNAGMTMGGVMFFREIPVKEKRVTKLFLPHWAALNKTGNFSILCQKNLIVRRYEKDNRASIYGQEGEPVKVGSKIKVVPLSNRKMSQVIEIWGNEIFNTERNGSRSYEAVKALSYIKDKRIIKPLIKAVEKEFASDAALRALAEFNDESAFNAIVSQINGKTNSIRSSAANALSVSKHPKAFDFLLTMKGDEDKFVRLAVLQSLGRIGTPASLKILREMLAEDRNKELIQYVESYLKNQE